MQQSLYSHKITISIVENGMVVVFVSLFLFVTYSTRLNYRKAFEMTIRAEKSS